MVYIIEGEQVVQLLQLLHALMMLLVYRPSIFLVFRYLVKFECQLVPEFFPGFILSAKLISSPCQPIHRTGK